MKKRFILKLAAMTAAFIFILTVLQASPHSFAAEQTDNPTLLFNSKCAMCHAKDGSGLPGWKSKGQPDFTSPDWQKSNTDAQIGEAIRNGKGKNMPAFKARLTEEQITALVRVVRGFGKR